MTNVASAGTPRKGANGRPKYIPKQLYTTTSKHDLQQAPSVRRMCLETFVNFDAAEHQRELRSLQFGGVRTALGRKLAWCNAKKKKRCSHALCPVCAEYRAQRNARRCLKAIRRFKDPRVFLVSVSMATCDMQSTQVRQFGTDVTGLLRNRFNGHVVGIEVSLTDTNRLLLHAHIVAQVNDKTPSVQELDALWKKRVARWNRDWNVSKPQFTSQRDNRVWYSLAAISDYICKPLVPADGGDWYVSTMIQLARAFKGVRRLRVSCPKTNKQPHINVSLSPKTERTEASAEGLGRVSAPNPVKTPERKTRVLVSESRPVRTTRGEDIAPASVGALAAKETHIDVRQPATRSTFEEKNKPKDDQRNNPEPRTLAKRGDMGQGATSPLLTTHARPVSSNPTTRPIEGTPPTRKGRTRSSVANRTTQKRSIAKRTTQPGKGKVAGNPRTSLGAHDSVSTLAPSEPKATKRPPKARVASDQATEGKTRHSAQEPLTQPALPEQGFAPHDPPKPKDGSRVTPAEPTHAGRETSQQHESTTGCSTRNSKPGTKHRLIIPAVKRLNSEGSDGLDPQCSERPDLTIEKPARDTGKPMTQKATRRSKGKAARATPKRKAGAQGGGPDTGPSRRAGRGATPSNFSGNSRKGPPNA